MDVRFPTGGRAVLPWILLLCGGGGVAFAAAAAAAGSGETPGPWDPFQAWHRAELPWLVAIQGSGSWEAWMRGLSALGPGRELGAVLGFMLFAVNARLATRFAVLLLGTLWLREILALAWESPRPFWYGPPIQAFADGALTRTTYGFPSGHAMVGTAIWCFAAMESRRAWAWAVAIPVALGICYSRLYLGMHFVSDVVAGSLLGAGCAWAYPRCEKRWLTSWSAWSPATRRTWVAGIVFAVLACGWWVRMSIGPVPEGAPENWARYFKSARSLDAQARLAGIALGLGWTLAGQVAWPSIAGVWWFRLLRVGFVGLVVKGMLEPAGRMVVRRFPESEGEWAHMLVVLVLHAVIAWSVWAGLPRLFAFVSEKLGVNRTVYPG